VGPDNLIITPIAPFGASIEGDLARPLSREASNFLVEQVDTHGIVVAPRQRLTLEDQRRLLQPFGRVLIKDLDYVASDDGVLNTSGMKYHSDFAFAHTPYKNLSLHAIEVVNGETSTKFANGALAFMTLSEDLRKRLVSLTATAVFSREYDASPPYVIPAGVAHFKRAVVIFHPRTARPILYINEAQTSQINGVSQVESDALLAELFDTLYSPTAILEHHWSVGDLLIWDNLILQHGRPNLQNITRRRLQRVSVADVGGDEMFPNGMENLAF
jgi:taurine dioxygenase